MRKNFPLILIYLFVSCIFLFSFVTFNALVADNSRNQFINMQQNFPAGKLVSKENIQISEAEKIFRQYENYFYNYLPTYEELGQIQYTKDLDILSGTDGKNANISQNQIVSIYQVDFAMLPAFFNLENPNLQTRNIYISTQLRTYLQQANIDNVSFKTSNGITSISSKLIKSEQQHINLPLEKQLHDYKLPGFILINSNKYSVNTIFVRKYDNLDLNTFTFTVPQELAEQNPGYEYVDFQALEQVETFSSSFFPILFFITGIVVFIASIFITNRVFLIRSRRRNFVKIISIKDFFWNELKVFFLINVCLGVVIYLFAILLTYGLINQVYNNSSLYSRILPIEGAILIQNLGTYFNIVYFLVYFVIFILTILLAFLSLSKIKNLTQQIVLLKPILNKNTVLVSLFLVLTSFVLFIFGLNGFFTTTYITNQLYFNLSLLIIFLLAFIILAFRSSFKRSFNLTGSIFIFCNCIINYSFLKDIFSTENLIARIFFISTTIVILLTLLYYNLEILLLRKQWKKFLKSTSMNPINGVLIFINIFIIIVGNVLYFRYNDAISINQETTKENNIELASYKFYGKLSDKFANINLINTKIDADTIYEDENIWNKFNPQYSTTSAILNEITWENYEQYSQLTEILNPEQGYLTNVAFLDSIGKYQIQENEAIVSNAYLESFNLEQIPENISFQQNFKSEDDQTDSYTLNTIIAEEIIENDADILLREPYLLQLLSNYVILPATVKEKEFSEYFINNYYFIEDNNAILNQDNKNYTQLFLIDELIDSEVQKQQFQNQLEAFIYIRNTLYALLNIILGIILIALIKSRNQRKNFIIKILESTDTTWKRKYLFQNLEYMVFISLSLIIVLGIIFIF